EAGPSKFNPISFAMDLEYSIGFYMQYTSQQSTGVSVCAFLRLSSYPVQSPLTNDDLANAARGTLDSRCGLGFVVDLHCRSPRRTRCTYSPQSSRVPSQR